MLHIMATGLKQRGRVEPIVLSPCDGPMHSRYHQAGISTIITDLPNCPMFNAWPSKRDYKRSLYAIEDILHREQPDVVVANTLLAFFFVNCAAKLRIPSVWYIHECYDDCGLKREFQPYLQRDIRQAFCRAEQVVFCSHAAHNAYWHFAQQDNFSVVQNCIDVSEINAFRDSVWASNRNNTLRWCLRTVRRRSKCILLSGSGPGSVGHTLASSS